MSMHSLPPPQHERLERPHDAHLSERSMNVPAAAAYADRYAPDALLVARDGSIAHERYAGEFRADTAHALYSGTKSFWGVAAAAAAADGILALDERVGDTIAAWNDDPRKARVTLRELLTLTSGIGFGGLGNAVPTYERALTVAIKDEPGERFTYGGIPLQVFGAVLARKLGPRTPHEYLAERVLEPAGVAIGSWRKLADGTQPLPTGAFLTANAWARFGALVLGDGAIGGSHVLPAGALAACFTGTPANPRYGVCWWLSPLPAHPDVVYASGSGGQALYVIPEQRTVVVRFGRGGAYKHDAFLRRLLDTAGETER
jgi:CubicO group peptidase (beta-lactamase class C family)